jgi:hypothetical protein
VTARFTPSQQTAGYLIERFQLGFGEGRLSPVARGAMGRIWRLSLPGHDYAVKELFWTADEAAVGREAAFRDAAAAAGVACPLNLRADDGRYICTLPRDLGGVAVRLFSWIEGRPVNRDDPGLPSWVGHTLGVLHGLRHPCDGIATDPWYDHVPEPARRDELLAKAEATKQPWSTALAEAIPLLRCLELGIQEPRPAGKRTSPAPRESAGRRMSLRWRTPRRTTSETVVGPGGTWTDSA